MERDYYMAKQKFCSFCNNEITIDNLGIEGLRQAKRSYNPIFMIDKYNIYIK